MMRKTAIKSSLCFLSTSLSIGFILLLVLLAETGVFHAAAQAEDAPEFTYKVGPEDVISITVFDNPELSGNFTISAEGTIVYPMLGQLRVSGMTILEIKEMITKVLEKDYLYNPIVGATVKEFKSKKVKILGNVGKPGIYYLDRPTRFFDLLSMAEGISPQLGKVMKGQKARIVRQRESELSKDFAIENMNIPPEALESLPVDATALSAGGDGSIQTIYIDLYQLLVEGHESINIYLKDGDIIYIPENQKIYVVGGIKKPGAFPYEEDISILKAITLAGGIQEKSSVESIHIRRIKNGEEEKIKVGMGDILQPDDIVEIITEIKKVHVIGEVTKPGSYSYEEEMSVLKAITLAGGPTQKAAVRKTIIKRIVDGREIKIDVSMSDVLEPDDIVEVPLSFW